jgi:Family of unknown function (DUF6152)
MSQPFWGRSGVLYAVLAFFGTGASAHHSYSMFDTSKQLQVTGAVRVLEWANPHVWLWVIVTDEKGSSAPFAFEGTSPGEMSRRSGWSKSIVSSGDTVTVTYTPFKDGRNGGHIKSVALPNGQTLDASPGAAPPAPGASPPKQ